MTPEQKAKELVEKMNYSHPEHEGYVAKQCALIAVDEIIKSSPNKPIETPFTIEYWKNVKKEINKL